VKNFKAVIFDLDGTLVDSFQAIRSGYNYALEQMNESRRLSLEQVKERVGGGLRESFFDLVGDERADEAVSLFRSRYREIFLKETFLLPYVFHVITLLSKKGILLGVVTNKYGDFSRALLAEFRLAPYLSVVIGDGDGFPLKPDPAIFSELGKRTGFSTEEFLFIGDGPIDIHFARNAGISVYAIATGNYSAEALLHHRPDRLIGSLEEILSCFS
jgi:HAD superfamily hydrolase (TIGR01509 family)